MIDKTVPLSSFASGLCRQRSKHKWTGSSLLHDTKTINLTLVQCGCHTSKY